MNSRKSKRQITDNELLSNDSDPIMEGCEGELSDQHDANVSERELSEGDISTEVSEQELQTEWQDKYMRLSAEFDNYRKRTLREKMELVAMGGEDVIKAMLPVLDDMDRALEAMNDSDDIVALRSGIELISHKTRETLKQRGLTEIDANGKIFDTDFHEAIAKIPAEEGQKGRVVDVVQRGYSLKDRVIRHSKVVVGE